MRMWDVELKTVDGEIIKHAVVIEPRRWPIVIIWKERVFMRREGCSTHDYIELPPVGGNIWSDKTYLRIAS